MVRPKHSNDAVSITDAPVRRNLIEHLHPKRHAAVRRDLNEVHGSSIDLRNMACGLQPLKTVARKASKHYICD